jgi:hypothetical protein
LVPTQIGLDHGRVSAHLHCSTFRDFVSELEHNQSIAKVHDDSHDVLDDEDRHATVSDSPDNRHEVRQFGTGQTGRYFVKQKEFRGTGQCPG